MALLIISNRNEPTVRVTLGQFLVLEDVIVSICKEIGVLGWNNYISNLTPTYFCPRKDSRQLVLILVNNLEMFDQVLLQSVEGSLVKILGEKGGETVLAATGKTILSEKGGHRFKTGRVRPGAWDHARAWRCIYCWKLHNERILLETRVDLRIQGKPT